MDRGAWWAIQSMGSQKVGHDWATERARVRVRVRTHTHTHTHTHTQPNMNQCPMDNSIIAFGRPCGAPRRRLWYWEKFLGNSGSTVLLGFVSKLSHWHFARKKREGARERAIHCSFLWGLAFPHRKVKSYSSLDTECAISHLELIETLKLISVPTCSSHFKQGVV